MECTIVVKPREPQTSENTIMDPRTCFDPENMGVSVRSSVTIRNGSAIITLDSERTKPKVKQKLGRTSNGYILEETRASRASAMITKVSKYVAIGSAVDKLCWQNPWIESHTTVTSGVKLIREFESKFKEREVVMEAGKAAAMELVRRGAGGLGFSMCCMWPHIMIY